MLQDQCETGAAATTRKFSTHAVPSGKRLGYWQELLDSVVISGAVTSDRKIGFGGRIRARSSPSGFQFADIASVPQEISHERSHVGRLTDEYLLISVQLHGHSVVRQGDQVIALEPGDIAIREANQPSNILFGTDWRKFMIKVPRSRVTAPLGPIDTICAIKVSGKSGIGTILSDFARALVREFDTLDPDVMASVESSLVGLVAGALGSSVGWRSRPTTAARAGHLERILDRIETHLADPELTPAKVAAEVGISVRYLHKIFETMDTTFSAHVREHRLERCRCDLRDPVRRHITITEICLDNGFNDSAQFSRVFKARYGVSPRRMR